MVMFVRTQHDREQEVRFKQVELQNKLMDLFVDVPIGAPQPLEEQDKILNWKSALRRVQNGNLKRFPLSSAQRIMKAPLLRRPLVMMGVPRPECNVRPSVLATHPLGEVTTTATPAISEGTLLFRTRNHLVAVSER